MRINSIHHNFNFKVRLTKDVKAGFDNLTENTKDFYGEQSKEYKTLCNNYRILKTYSQNYVVGEDFDENTDYPYCFKNKKEGEDKIIKTNYSQAKEQLYSDKNLRWLALLVYVNDKKSD